MTRSSRSSRAIAALVCFAATIACLGYAYWRSGLPDWWRGHGGGVPYVVFWITFGFVIFPTRRAIVPVCVLATAFACLAEVLQLWKPEWLTRFRDTGFGAALLGSGFDWADFPPYFIGGGIGFFVLRLMIAFAANADDK